MHNLGFLEDDFFTLILSHGIHHHERPSFKGYLFTTFCKYFSSKQITAPGERWHGGSALQLASSNGSIEMVRMLLEATSDPNMVPLQSDFGSKFMATFQGRLPTKIPCFLVGDGEGYLEILACCSVAVFFFTLIVPWW